MSATEAPQRGDRSRLVRGNVIGTAIFVAVVAVAVPLRDERAAQIAIAAVSMVLFAIGVGTSLWAYTSALELSRSREVGVANLFLLTGNTAPKPIKRTMSIALATQIVVAIVGASVGAAGLQDGDLNALAFGVLVPMFGIGLNGLWAARYGAYGPRIDPASQPSNRTIE